MLYVSRMLDVDSYVLSDSITGENMICSKAELLDYSEPVSGVSDGVIDVSSELLTTERTKQAMVLGALYELDDFGFLDNLTLLPDSKVNASDVALGINAFAVNKPGIGKAELILDSRIKSVSPDSFRGMTKRQLLRFFVNIEKATDYVADMIYKIFSFSSTSILDTDKRHSNYLSEGAIIAKVRTPDYALTQDNDDFILKRNRDYLMHDSLFDYDELKEEVGIKVLREDFGRMYYSLLCLMLHERAGETMSPNDKHDCLAWYSRLVDRTLWYINPSAVATINYMLLKGRDEGIRKRGLDNIQMVVDAFAAR